MKDIEVVCKRIVVIIDGKKHIDTGIEDLKNSYKAEHKYIIKTKDEKFPEYTKISSDVFELSLDNVISIENGLKELDEIIYEIFKNK